MFQLQLLVTQLPFTAFWYPTMSSLMTWPTTGTTGNVAWEQKLAMSRAGWHVGPSRPRGCSLDRETQETCGLRVSRQRSGARRRPCVSAPVSCQHELEWAVSLRCCHYGGCSPKEPSGAPELPALKEIHAIQSSKRWILINCTCYMLLSSALWAAQQLKQQCTQALTGQLFSLYAIVHLMQLKAGVLLGNFCFLPIPFHEFWIAQGSRSLWDACISYFLWKTLCTIWKRCMVLAILRFIQKLKSWIIMPFAVFWSDKKGIE